jgi:hypothetical protein
MHANGKRKFIFILLLETLQKMWLIATDGLRQFKETVAARFT